MLNLQTLLSLRERVWRNLTRGGELAPADDRLVVHVYLKAPRNHGAPPERLADQILAGEHLQFFLNGGCSEFINGLGRA